MLLGRGYKAGDIRQAIEFGVKMNREETIEKVVREDNKNRNRVRYTITYDPKLPHLPAILSKNWNVMVDSDRRLNKAFPAPPMASLKRGPNLQDKLIRARARAVGPGFRACKAGRRSCSLCPFTGPASDKKTVITSVTIRNTGTVLPIQQTISCRDTHCLYILSCTKTGYMKQYAGLSSRPLYIRFAEHLADIQSSSDCTVAGIGRSQDTLSTTWCSCLWRSWAPGTGPHSGREKWTSSTPLVYCQLASTTTDRGEGLFC